MLCLCGYMYVFVWGLVGLRVVILGIGNSIWSGFAGRLGSVGVSFICEVLDAFGLEEKWLRWAENWFFWYFSFWMKRNSRRQFTSKEMPFYFLFFIIFNFKFTFFFLRFILAELLFVSGWLVGCQEMLMKKKENRRRCWILFSVFFLMLSNVSRIQYFFSLNFILL